MLRAAHSVRTYIGVQMGLLFRGIAVSIKGDHLRLRCLVLIVLASASLLAWAKDVPLVAIEIYDGPSGSAYVQLSNVLINNKIELRECDECGTAPIDKSAYNKLPKIVISAGGSLERGGDGVLRYTDASGTRIVVPVNAKYDKSPSLSASDLADQATLKAIPVAPATTIPPIGKGVTLVFIAAPDVELAEYLRARRANDVPGWQTYLEEVGSSPHSDDAHMRLAGLFAASGLEKLASYQQTADGSSPAYDNLKAAHDFAEQARAASASLPQLAQLDQGIGTAQAGIVDKGRHELDQYRAALNAHSAGYVHLARARKYTDLTEGVVTTATGQALMSDVLKDTNAIDGALRQAESAVTARQFDQAVGNVTPYRFFADEEPRITRVVDAAYSYHMEKGRQAASLPNWTDAITEFTKAGTLKDTSENRSLLANAREQQVMEQDRDAAGKALGLSKGYEDSKDVLKAYEVLNGLPLAQRTLVAADLERMKPAYVQRSSDFAKDLRKAHDPIRGVSDETEIERAYVYLDRAYKLSQNDSFRDRKDLLGDELSAYLLDQSKKYLSKPAGSGTELGWTYLSEALPYKASNLDAIRDAMTDASAAHALRSRLSVRVQFRDQTSQRDSAGFAGQLENALIAGLEGMKIPVKVVRAGEATPVEPDYNLEGDVLQHHLTTVPVMEAVESKYLASTREVQSDDWNKANRAYENAQIDLQTAQAALQGAQAKGDKRTIDTSTAQIDTTKMAVEEAHVKLDSTQKTVTVDVTRPYSYTKKTVTLTASIQMQFRINDSFSSDRGEVVPINKEEQKQYTQLENVKPEDTEGVRAVGTTVDPIEFITFMETSALDGLIAEVRKRVEALPRRLFDQARQREDGDDLDGAGEAYLRYLEIVTPDETSVEQKHAREFLIQQFDMHPGMTVAAR
ncbi:MAG TPA: hypothetical protein VGJ21_17025 [Terracidiphilus sp.]